MKKTGYIFVILSALFFAIGGLLIKVNTWSSLSINGMRSIFAFLVMGIYMKSIGHKFRINWTIFWGAIANVGMSVTFVMANKLTTAANTIVLQFTMPIYLILFLWIFWKEKPDKTAVITVLCSFVGICFFFMGSLSPSGTLGNILALVSGLLYSVIFLIKKMPNADFESSVLLSFVISFAISIPFLMKESDFGTTNIITIVVLGVVQIGFAYICLAKGLDHVPPIAAALISMIEPIVNPLLVAIFYHETIGGYSFIGAVIVLASALAYNIHTIKK